MRLRHLCLFAFLALTTLLAQAAALGVVEQVRGPAWLLRTGLRQPLAPGMSLQDHDRIETGTDARVYLMLGDGGRVKLGAATHFAIAQGQDRGDRVYRALLDVTTGAFRYTTQLLNKLQPRDLAIRVGTSTIGIRGTDIWGRASADEDMAVLIEGHVEVRRGMDRVDMRDALSQYRAPKEGEILPLVAIDQATLTSLASDTEIEPASGARSTSGRWPARLGSVATQAEALALYDRVRSAGYAARIQVANRGKGHLYTVYVPGQHSRGEAKAVALGLRQSLALTRR